MKVFIAGATGALGLPLVRELVRRGHQVIGMTRSSKKRPLLEGLGAQAVIADALNAAGLAQAVREAAPTHVVHMLTALPKNGSPHTKDLATTNALRTTGTTNLLEAAITAGAQRIVGESFATVYGYGDQGRQTWTEGDLPPVHETDAGLRATVEALRSLEAQLSNATEQGRIEAISLRYGMTYGPENPSTLSMLQMLRKRWLPLVRGADALTSWVHTADVATATIAALERGRPGAIYNVADDEPVGFNQFVKAAAQAIGAPHPYTVPRWLLGWLAPFMVAMVTSRLPLANTRARNELAWRPQFPSYREGLAQVAREFQAQEEATPAVDRAPL
jgi:nucleoside-diphosphate-sugar epimerase